MRTSRSRTTLLAKLCNPREYRWPLSAEQSRDRATKGRTGRWRLAQSRQRQRGGRTGRFRSLAVGSAGFELRPDALLSDPKPRAQHQRSGRQRDPEPARLGGCAFDQLFDRFNRHIGGEQVKADCYPFLGTPLSSRRDRPCSCKPSKNDDARKAFYGTV